MKRGAVIAAVALGLAGCGTIQDALGGNGLEGANFVWLFGLFLVVCAVMYVVVMGGLAVALWRRRRPSADYTVESGRHADEPRLAGRLLALWTAVIVLGLLGLTVASFLVDRSNARAASDPQLKIKVTGNQWWWDIAYEGRTPAEGLHSANEIHLPVGVPVEVTLQSNDVIHSFWIPNLAGKQDLIPGRQTDIQLVAQKAGTYRGQCAEFCGIQHAHMALDVTVESAANFQRWVKASQQPAAAPRSPLELAGYRIVTSRQCASCHAIAGTPANATIAPELTHVASRRSIAAGTLPMSRQNLARWIADPQGIKPGSNMPKVDLTPPELAAVSAYLARLQ